jgi:hypothetical protein
MQPNTVDVALGCRSPSGLPHVDCSTPFDRTTNGPAWTVTPVESYPNAIADFLRALLSRRPAILRVPRMLSAIPGRIVGRDVALLCSQPHRCAVAADWTERGATHAGDEGILNGLPCQIQRPLPTRGAGSATMGLKHHIAHRNRPIRIVQQLNDD